MSADVPADAAGAALEPPLPRRLQVEVTGACNLSCRMCLVRYRPKLGRRQGAMTLATFAALLDDLPDLDEVTLQGLGEPLLCPDLLPMIELASGRGIRVGFNTNATLLSRPLADRLVAAGTSWVHVSLDGATAATYESIRDGSNLRRVQRNLDGLVAARRAAGTATPRILLVFVAMQRNVAELPELVRLAARTGVDGLWVQNLSHSFSDTDPAGSYAEIRRFAEDEALFGEAAVRRDAVFAEARAVAEEVGLDLRLPRLAERPDRREQGTPGCDWPWHAAYVTHEGHVQPCCMVMGADRVRLGNVAQERFPAIWRSGPYREFRAQLLGGEPPDVCRGCSLYRGLF